MTSGLIVVVVLGASDPRSTLVVPSSAGLDRQWLHEELSLRLPNVELSERNVPGYRLLLTRDCEIDAVAGALAARVCVRARLLDPLGAALMSDTIESSQGQEWVARRLAVLTEGALRMHLGRLAALLEVIHDSRPAPERTADPEPLLFVDVGAAAAVFPEAPVTVFGLEAGVEIAVWRWLHPRLEVSGTWPRSGETDGVRLSARETSLAILAQVPMPVGPIDLSIGGGYVMCIVAATARLQNESTSVHSGARLRGAAAFAILGRLHGVVGLTADVLPRYPEHAWQGKIVARRGAWRLAATGGVRLRF